MVSFVVCSIFFPLFISQSPDFLFARTPTHDRLCLLVKTSKPCMYINRVKREILGRLRIQLLITRLVPSAMYSKLNCPQLWDQLPWPCFYKAGYCDMLKKKNVESKLFMTLDIRSFVVSSNLSFAFAFVGRVVNGAANTLVRLARKGGSLSSFAHLFPVDFGRCIVNDVNNQSFCLPAFSLRKEKKKLIRLSGVKI